MVEAAVSLFLKFHVQESRNSFSRQLLKLAGGGKVENMDEGDRENGKKPLVYLVWAHD